MKIKIQKIKKRDGTLVKFDQDRITQAIFKALTVTGQGDGKLSQRLSNKVVKLLERRFKKNEIPNVEQIQNIVEEVLILENLIDTARAYILYREQRRRIREAVKVWEEAIEIYDNYIDELDWQVKENANMAYSLQGLNHYGVSILTKRYWLNKIYPKEIREAVEKGDFHIHNLDCLATYCCGWDLYDLLLKGFGGVAGKVEARPPKHLRSALGQIVNFFYTLQGESAGAQAFSNFDTLLAPFIKYDNLSYEQVKQALQEFLYNCAIPTRVGFQTPFTNVTLDIKPSLIFANQPVIIGGKHQKESYGEFQEEMNLFNRAFYEVMMEGDKNSRPFTFPIPTINITKDFPWEEETLEPMWQATIKYGVNYFANFIQSTMKPEDVRSMCCRLRLSNRELYKRGGGLFGSNPLTGCYDEKTEILTENGWKFFKDLTKQDRVFTLSQDNKIELHYPRKIFKYNYSGLMIRFQEKLFDLFVTPNHRMVTNHKYNLKREFVEAKDFNPSQHLIPKEGKWEGEEKEYFELPPVYIINSLPVSLYDYSGNLETIRKANKEISICQITENFNFHSISSRQTSSNLKYVNQQKIKIEYKTSSLKIKMDEWLKFFGFWLAKGSLDNEKNASIKGYRVMITQIQRKNIKEIKEVLKNLPFFYSEKKDKFIIYNKQLWNYLYQFDNTKYTKFIPKEIKGLSKRQLKILFDWMMKGNSSLTKKTSQVNYLTFSKKLADDLQEIILKLGWSGFLKIKKIKKTSQIKKRKTKVKIVYEIKVEKSKYYLFSQRKKERTIIQQLPYKGKVYCCEVPNHTVYVRRNGKVTWCGNSIGVVTINMPKIAYLSKTKKEFFEKLTKVMDLAKESLEIKRKALENFMEKGLYPYSKYYLQGVKKMRGKYFGNHFSTIGLVGMNEAILNFLGENIASKDGQKFALEVLNFMRKKLVKYQQQTGNLYNLEATPAEGTSYRLALKDKEQFPDIITAGTKEVPYYTNSTQLPVNYSDDIFEVLKLQDKLQACYTGGTVLHLFLGEQLTDVILAKKLIKKIFEKFHLPYLTLTPTFSICPVHGYLSGEHWICPKCTIKQSCEVYSRIVGYLRPVQQWNKGKVQEFQERKEFKIKTR